MTEQLVKYMAGNARIFCVSLSHAVDQSAELNHLCGEDRTLLGKLEAFSACIASLQKEERASVTVRLSLPGAGIFSATADRDGLIRGRKEDPCCRGEGTLEVTLQLPLRGNYTGVVLGDDLDSLVGSYFAQSLQISAVCRVFSSEDQFWCITVEQLPGEPSDLVSLCDLACQRLPRGSVPEEFLFLESSPFRYGCSCSRGALMRLVSSMPLEERAELAENGKIVTYCNACGKKYVFEI